MSKFPPEAFDTLGYYVYRLIDPVSGKTFYVGKGCRNRVFDHVNDALKFEEGEDEVSAKIQTIRDILKSGRKVKHVIHRYGMEEKEAFEVEAALIDVYASTPEIGDFKGIQSGHDADRGVIDTEELIRNLTAVEYDDAETDIDYIIVKVTDRVLKANDGDRYEATRKAWRLSLDIANNYKYVLSTTNGIVKEVYEVKDWYKSKEKTRIEFNGQVAADEVRNFFINKKLPSIYRTKGMASSALYKKNTLEYIAQTKVLKLLQSGCVSSRELEKLLTAEYSQKAFGLEMPLLAKADSDYHRENYDQDAFDVNGNQYVLCTQWSDRKKSNSRALLEAWLKAHDFDKV